MLEIFNMMERRLAQPDCAFFTHYREDFFVHDRKQLVEFGGRGADYLWIVRSAGTHLIQLGVSVKASDWGFAALEAESVGKVFHVTTSALREVSHEKARELLARMDYTTQEGECSAHVSYGGETLAMLEVQTVRPWAEVPRHSVHIKSTGAAIRSSLHLSALRRIAQGIVEKKFNLFAPIDAITVDGTCVLQALAAAHEREARVAVAA